MTAKRVIAQRSGGPEVLVLECFDPPAPGSGEVLVRNEAIGVNFIDTYHRSGLYSRAYPSGIGFEAAGEIIEVGDNVSGYKPGDRIVYQADATYATHAVAAASQCFKLPHSMSFEVGAASLTKGLTARMLAEGVRPVTSGMTVLVYAAAGGVGQLLVPWVKALGGFVIAHVGSAAKMARVRALGADYVHTGPYDALAAEVRRLTKNEGAQLVLDGVGNDSWAASLASVARRGLIVSYGNASGVVPPVAPLDLLRAGSVFLTRPTLLDWMPDTRSRNEAWARVTEMIGTAVITPEISLRLPLADAAEAHRLLESRKTMGSIILLP